MEREIEVLDHSCSNTQPLVTVAGNLGIQAFHVLGYTVNDIGSRDTSPPAAYTDFQAAHHGFLP